MRATRRGVEDVEGCVQGESVVSEMFLHPFPFWRLIERVQLENRVRIEPVWNEDASTSFAPPRAAFDLFLMPTREIISDANRVYGPICTAGPAFHKAVAEVMRSRTITAEAPLRVFEVGANLGECGFSVAALLGESRVELVALEPLPAAVRRLRRTAKVNNFKFRVVQAAAGSRA